MFKSMRAKLLVSMAVLVVLLVTVFVMKDYFARNNDILKYKTPLFEIYYRNIDGFLKKTEIASLANAVAAFIKTNDVDFSVGYTHGRRRRSGPYSFDLAGLWYRPVKLYAPWTSKQWPFCNYEYRAYPAQTKY